MIVAILITPRITDIAKDTGNQISARPDGVQLLSVQRMRVLCGKGAAETEMEERAGGAFMVHRRVQTHRARVAGNDDGVDTPVKNLQHRGRGWQRRSIWIGWIAGRRSTGHSALDCERRRGRPRSGGRTRRRPAARRAQRRKRWRSGRAGLRCYCPRCGSASSLAEHHLHCRWPAAGVFSVNDRFDSCPIFSIIPHHHRRQ